MQTDFAFCDDLGPTKIIELLEPTIGLRAALVVDNVAAGPSLGGIRVAPDVTLEECRRLARMMTLKNAAAGLPHGGGKAVLCGDPKMPIAQKEQLIRGLACALRYVEEYIPSTDMGTDERCMAWIKDEIGRAVCLPREMGGIASNEIGATGWGLRHAAEVAARHCHINLRGARFVVQGFGAVGKHAARFLAAEGAMLVAAADSVGTIANRDGLDVGALIELKAASKSVVDYSRGDVGDKNAVVDVECDIWIPAARPDVLRSENADRLRAKIVLPGANIPTTPSAERALHERGVLCVPDFIANAGGVIADAIEYAGGTKTAAFAAIRDRIRRNTETVLAEANERGIMPSQAAVELATERVKKAMSYRRWSVF